jgi:hypothetical protein
LSVSANQPVKEEELQKVQQLDTHIFDMINGTDRVVITLITVPNTYPKES